MFNARQGDVAIKQIDSLPKGLKRLEGLIVRTGEATGHAHALIAEEPNKAEIYVDDKGTMYLHVEGSAILTHQEHKLLEIPQGDYQIGDEREFDAIEGIRKVMD